MPDATRIRSGLYRFNPGIPQRRTDFHTCAEDLVAALDQQSMRASEPLPTHLSPNPCGPTRRIVNAMANTSVERESNVLYLFKCFTCRYEQRSTDKSILQDVESRHVCPIDK